MAGALAAVVHAVTGFSNKSLRGLVAGLLGHDYTPSRMSYDLRRLRLHGLIRRLPRSNTYVVTPEGIRVAVFYSKLQNRLLRPLLGRKPTARPARHPPRPRHPRTRRRRRRPPERVPPGPLGIIAVKPAVHGGYWYD